MSGPTVGEALSLMALRLKIHRDLPGAEMQLTDWEIEAYLGLIAAMPDVIRGAVQEGLREVADRGLEQALTLSGAEDAIMRKLGMDREIIGLRADVDRGEES